MAQLEPETWSDPFAWVEPTTTDASVAAPPPATAVVAPPVQEADSDDLGESFGRIQSTCLLVALAVPQLAWLIFLGYWLHAPF